VEAGLASAAARGGQARSDGLWGEVGELGGDRGPGQLQSYSASFYDGDNSSRLCPSEKLAVDLFPSAASLVCP
jgi:hypothetical protein